ncbi:MAG TPA: YbgC/FadM family acyl-CoA thioesterase [Caulobacteraceae bacterium]
MGWFEGREHLLAVRVYYEDTDFTGLVYHAAYARFFERGRSDHLRLAGLAHATLLANPDPCAFVITRLAIDFRAAARIDDALLIRTYYDAITGPRFLISQRATRRDKTIAEATVEAACIAPSGRARRPPADLVARLAPYLVSPQTP